MVATALFALVACAPRALPVPAAPARSASSGTTLLVRLDRAICLGTCPAYTIVVDHSGAIRFHGQSNVCEPGEIAERLSSEQVSNLRTAIAESGFASTPEHCCDCNVTDTPTITLTVADPPPARTIVDTYGCEEASTPVQRLAERIDAIVRIERWIGTEEERKKCRF